MTEAAVAQQPRKSFLTSGEVARLLGCSSAWIKQLIAKGVLDSHRIDGKGWHRVSARTLQKYAEEHEIVLDWSLL